MEIGDRFQGYLNEASDLSETDDDDQPAGSNLIDISESEIFFRNKSSTARSKRADKPNYNSFQLSSRQQAASSSRFGQHASHHQAKYNRTVSVSSEESVLESTENDSLLQEQQSNRNKIQLNPIREWVPFFIFFFGIHTFDFEVLIKWRHDWCILIRRVLFCFWIGFLN